ncbi:sensor histidine kinase [Streptomyces mauvecolor]
MRAARTDDLGGRIALEAPPGELKQLADTFDELLGRIEQLVSAQKRFVANAAHELRTPLALQRAAAQIGPADPTPEKVARVRSKLMALSKDGEHLIDGLLLLSATDRGLERREAVALDEVATATADELTSLARETKVSMVRDIHPLRVEGDEVPLKHLVHNLLNNAIRYNEPGGRVPLDVGADILKVSNSAPRVPEDVVPRLFEPFRRAHERTSAPGEGAGLGLSIVKSIAAAHGAKATARQPGRRPDGTGPLPRSIDSGPARTSGDRLDADGPLPRRDGGPATISPKARWGVSAPCAQQGPYAPVRCIRPLRMRVRPASKAES